MSSNATSRQKQLICHAPDCHLEIRDIEEGELIRIAQDHAQRIHQINVSLEVLRAAIQPVESSVQPGK